MNARSAHVDACAGVEQLSPAGAQGRSRDSRLPALDLARGFAAIAVLVFHYCYINDAARVGSPRLADFAVYGYLGVHFFFLLSGFVIFMSLDRASGAFDFALARASRLYPAYVLSILITLAVMYVIAGELPVSVADALLNLTMFSEVFNAERVNPAYWTLSREVVFYGLVFIGMVLGGSRVVVAGMMCWFALSFGHAVFGMPLVDRMLILKWTPLFFGGASLYLASRAEGGSRMFFVMCFICSIPLACYYAVEAFAAQRGYFEFWSADIRIVVILIVCLYFAMAWIVAARSALSWVPCRLVEWIGGGSYILYLIHERVGMELVTRYYDDLGLLIVGTVVLLMMVFSVLIYVYFDKPVQLWCRKVRMAVRSFGRPSCLSGSSRDR